MSAKDTEAQIDVQAMTRDEAMLVLTNLANTLWQHNPRTHRAIKVTLDAYEAQVRENAGRQRMQELREKDVARLTAALAGCQEERDKQYDAAREVIDRQAAALADRTAEGNVLVARLGETEAALAEARSKTELRDRELDTMSRIATKYQKERDEARKAGFFAGRTFERIGGDVRYAVILRPHLERDFADYLASPPKEQP
jgi:hypothetical protein